MPAVASETSYRILAVLKGARGQLFTTELGTGVVHNDTECGAIEAPTADLPITVGGSRCPACWLDVQPDWAALAREHDVGETSPWLGPDASVMQLFAEETPVTCSACRFEGLVTGEQNLAAITCPMCSSDLEVA